MTVTSASNNATFLGNGVTTAFGFNFACETTADIQVYYTDAAGVVTLLNTLQYTITLNAPVAPNPTPIGGLVVYPVSGSPIATGTKLTILRSAPAVQDSSYANQGTLYPTSIEQSFDAAVMLIQQLSEILGRQLTVAVSDSTPGPLPSATQRASQVLGFDSSGNPIAVSTVPNGQISAAMAPVCNAASIAAAQALLGINATGYLPVGAEFDFPGVVAPQFFFMERHQAISRVSFPELFDILAPDVTCTISSGSPVVTIAARVDGLQPTTGYYAGMAVEAAGVISPGATILSLTNTTITLTSNALANGSTCKIFPHGNGDGSSTYNVPEGRTYTYAGMDPQSGTTRLNKAQSQGVDAAGMGNVGGEQGHTTTVAEMAAHAHPGSTVSITDPGHTHTTSPTVLVLGAGGGTGAGAEATGTVIVNSNTTGITASPNIASQGGGGAHNTVQPTSIRNKIIFAGRATF